MKKKLVCAHICSICSVECNIFFNSVLLEYYSLLEIKQTQRKFQLGVRVCVCVCVFVETHTQLDQSATFNCLIHHHIEHRETNKSNKSVSIYRIET